MPHRATACLRPKIYRWGLHCVEVFFALTFLTHLVHPEVVWVCNLAMLFARMPPGAREMVQTCYDQEAKTPRCPKCVGLLAPQDTWESITPGGQAPIPLARPATTEDEKHGNMSGETCFDNGS
eukprot:2160049-Amphidinium_carterae.3